MTRFLFSVRRSLSTTEREYKRSKDDKQQELTISKRYKVTKGLLDRFGEKRVIDSPITESGFAGLTTGAALAGLHPVVSES